MNEVVNTKEMVLMDIVSADLYAGKYLYDEAEDVRSEDLVVEGNEVNFYEFSNK